MAACSHIPEPEKLREALAISQKKIRVVQMQLVRAKQSKSSALVKAQEKMRKQSYTYKLLHHGEYRPSVWRLAHALAKSGCSQELVGPMIRMVGSTIGVKVKGKLSRRTVQRSIREGGVASRIQMGYELANSKSMFYEHYVI